MKRVIAFFDFDGTITIKDTFVEFIRYAKGSFRTYLGLFLHLHYIMAYKTGLYSNQSAKEKVLTHFFGGMPAGEFDKLCAGFSDEVLPKLIRPYAVDEINRLKKLGAHVVVVSASPENWIRKWAGQMQVDLIGSQLEILNGKITGKISGKNCHGIEKVRRIQELHTMSEYDEVFAYGDTSGDHPMMDLAKNSFYKPFRRQWQPPKDRHEKDS